MSVIIHIVHLLIIASMNVILPAFHNIENYVCGQWSSEMLHYKE